MHAFEADFRDGLIRMPYRALQIFSPGGDDQNAASRSEINVVAVAGRGVKDLDTLEGSCLLETCNLLSRLKSPRIAPGRNDHAHRCIRGPAEGALTDAPVHRGLKRVHQIALEAHEDRLGFRVTES